MSSILDELKYKYPNTEGVQKANNIAEGVAAMPTGGSGGGSESLFIVGGGARLGESSYEGTLDKTWQEIHDAMLSKICVVVITADNGIIQELITDATGDMDSGYIVTIGGTPFETNTANGYPAIAQ